MSTPSSSSSSGVRDNSIAIPTIAREAAKVEKWIKDHAISAGNLSAVLEYLALKTLPADLAESDVIVDPLREALDTQLWFWNLAADCFASTGAVRAASEVNAGMYCAMLALQLKYRARIHKGMPLCNIGYFLADRDSLSTKIIAWLLGTAEDALTNLSTVTENLSFRNLSTTTLPPAILDHYVQTLHVRFLRLSIIPFFPEIALDSWLHPTSSTLSRTVIDSITSVETEVLRVYPKVPQQPLATLAQAWEPFGKLLRVQL